MIESLRLINFKGHQETEISLNPMTALVGPNSSGKTSVLQALSLLSLLGTMTPNQIFRKEATADVLVRDGETFLTLCLKGIEEGKVWELSLQSRKAESGWSHSSSWVWGGEPEKEDGGIQVRAKIPEGENVSLFQAVHLKLNATSLAAPSYTQEEVPRVEFDGWGLASTISYLKTYEDERFEALMDLVRQVIPQVKRIRVRKAQVQLSQKRVFSVDNTNIPFDDSREIWGDELVFDMIGAKEVPAHAVSERTILAVGLLTVLVSPSCPNVVLLDDVEQALHPKAQRELVEVLKSLLEKNENLQIVMTTHSPYIVDQLEPSDVCVLATDSQGVVHAQPLAKHPNAKQALNILTTGEFLSAEGENWVLPAENNNDCNSCMI